MSLLDLADQTVSRTYRDRLRREEDDSLYRRPLVADGLHIGSDLGWQALTLKCAGEGQRTSGHRSDERPMGPEFFQKIGTEGLEVAALIAPGGDGSGRRQDVRADPLPRKLATDLLKLMMRAPGRHLVELEPHVTNELVLTDSIDVGASGSTPASLRVRAVVQTGSRTVGAQALDSIAVYVSRVLEHCWPPTPATPRTNDISDGGAWTSTGDGGRGAAGGGPWRC